MEKVAGQLPVLLRLISSSVALANHAGVIIRDVMSRGELGIVEKVGAPLFLHILNLICFGCLFVDLFFAGCQ